MTDFSKVVAYKTELSNIKSHSLILEVRNIFKCIFENTIQDANKNNGMSRMDKTKLLLKHKKVISYQNKCVLWQDLI